MLRRRALALVSVPLLLAAAACGDDDGGDAGGGGSFGSGDGFSVAAALAEVPSRFDEDGVIINIGDLVAATEASGLEAPTGAGDAELIPWVMALTAYGDEGGDVFVPLAELLGHQYLARSQEIDDELGWSIVDVDAYVEVNKPPHAMMVAVGDIDPGRVESAEVSETAEGIVTAGEGEDLSQDITGRTAARPLGRPLHLAPRDGSIAVGRSLADLERWVADEESTLAGIAAYRELAGHLDDADPYGAVIARGAAVNLAVDPAQMAEMGGLTAMYDLVGIAWSHVDGAAVVTIVHRFASADTASAQVEVLREMFEEGTGNTGQPLSDHLVLDDVVADGNVTITTLGLADGARAVAPYQMLVSRDVPFAVAP